MHSSFNAYKHGSYLSQRIAGAIAITAAVFTISCPALAQSSLTRSQVEGVIPAIEAYVEKTMNDRRVPGVAIGIVADDELVYAKGFGVRSIDSEAPIDADTVFQIGSTSKAFLATTEAMLVDEDKLAWDDRVIDHDPEFRLHDPWATREFRIDDLLAQRSGLPGWTLTDMMIYGYPPDDITHALRYIRPVTSFRSTFSYQNAFHLVAQRIVANLENAASWSDVLQTRILKPLGMDATSSTAEGYINPANRAFGHRLEENGAVIDPISVFPYNAVGAGGINSTVRDMGQWLRFHINKGQVNGQQLVSAEVLEQTYMPKVTASGLFGKFLSLGEGEITSYASGWIVHSLPYGHIIDHAGGTTSFNSYVAFDPDRQFGIVVLTNALDATNDNGIAIPLGKYIIDRLLDRPEVDHAAQPFDIHQEAPEHPETAIAPRPLEQYAGRYHSPTLGTVDIAINADNKLSFELGPHHLPVVLEPWSSDIFTAKITLPIVGSESGAPMRDTARVHFRLDDTGQITRLDWGSRGAPGQPPFMRVKTGQ